MWELESDQTDDITDINKDGLRHSFINPCSRAEGSSANEVNPNGLLVQFNSKELNRSVVSVSYPAGNTSRHMGQLCSPPPVAPSPSCLTFFCNSSVSPTAVSLFVPFSCIETRPSEAAAADGDGDGDDAGLAWLWREGCDLLEGP